MLCCIFAENINAMTFTIEQYEKLKNAIVDFAISGILTVHYGDKQVTYRSLAEMKDILRMMEEDLFPERFGRRRKYAEVTNGRRC